MVWNIQESLDKKCPFCGKTIRQHEIKTKGKFAIVLCSLAPKDALTVDNGIPFTNS